jgi:hypothetical protein
MKSKTKTELSKMTKKNLLLHIENMQLMIENDHLETQKANREMQDIVSKYTDTSSIEDIQKAAGILRYQVFHHNFKSSEDKKKMLKIVDIFMNSVV